MIKCKSYCRHSWVWVSHNSFKDGEYAECSKCGTLSFEHRHKAAALNNSYKKRHYMY